MAKRPDFGTKMECASCGVRFFDLNKTPITCPKCAYVYPSTDEKNAPVVEEKPKEEKSTSTDDNNEEDAEFVSLEEADAATISELTGDDDDSTAPDEDSFLEEDGTSTNVEDIAINTAGDEDSDS